ncbi:S-layer homology domain-containing protein [Heliobacterium chlorum]|uniref:S-layer homology domain-containing protein n=1 Tax=Heliobacterium chlorum TaxID=2698 RepID=A0ABR7T138_HELCL|nr:S-layer homology domain-containing protein [Heliobacterium chlorum]MBC9784499.1 S-layer homology domain-containing protein [Heliobacterium chlorum]
MSQTRLPWRKFLFLTATVCIFLGLSMPAWALTETHSIDLGTNNYGIRPTITITFDKTIKTTSAINAIQFKPQTDGGTTVTASVESPGDDKLRITPVSGQNLSYGTQYKLTVPRTALADKSDATNVLTDDIEITFTTIALTDSAFTPKNLTYRVTGPSSVEWTWTYSGGPVTGFKLYAGNDNTGSFINSSQGTSNLKITEGNLVDGNSYTRTLYAYNGTNYSSKSNTVNFTFNSLAPPLDFKADPQSITSREILWTWTDNAYGETGYNIYDYDTDDLIGRVEAGRTSFQESGLERNHTYRRYVRAYRAGDGTTTSKEGDKSIYASARTDDSDSSSGSNSSSSDRSRIADALQYALDNAVSASDVVIIDPSDVDDDKDYVVMTEKNRYVAFTSDALDDYGEGRVRISTSDVELKIPAKLLDRSDDSGGMAVGLREYVDNTSAPTGKLRVGTAYEFDLIRYSDYTNKGYTENEFDDDDEDVIITFYYDYWRTSNPQSLKIYTMENGNWAELPSSVNTADRAVTAKVNHFSRFALFETPTGASGLVPGTSTIPYPGAYGYPGFNTNLPTPAGYPPGFGPGYGAGFNDTKPGYNPSQYSSPVTNAYSNYGGIAYTQGAYSGGANTSFIDITGHWARSQIETLAGKGILSGTAPRMFEPDKAVTRAEFLTMLMRTQGSQDLLPSSLPFQDVRADDWFAPSLRQALQRRIILTGDQHFRPYDPITRQDMAAWVGRSLSGRMAFGTSIDPTSFKDWQSVNQNLRDSVASAVRGNLIHGRPDGSFDPLGSTTRAEAATVIYSFLTSVR